MPSRGPKVSRATQVVLDARKKYPEVLKGVVSHLGNPPYMKEKLDYRTRDKQLLQMTPDEMIALARTDPAAAEEAAQRIHELEQKAPPLPPGMGDFEG